MNESPNLLDRVINTTEHHETAVPEQPIKEWNSRLFNCDLADCKNAFESIALRIPEWRLIGSTPTMTVIERDEDKGVEYHFIFEPIGVSKTHLIIKVLNDQGRDLTEVGRNVILPLLNTCDELISRRLKQHPPVRSYVLPRQGGFASRDQRRMAAIIAAVILIGIVILTLIARRAPEAPAATPAIARPSAKPQSPGEERPDGKQRKTRRH